MAYFSLRSSLVVLELDRAIQPFHRVKLTESRVLSLAELESQLDVAVFNQFVMKQPTAFFTHCLAKGRTTHQMMHALLKPFISPALLESDTHKTAFINTFLLDHYLKKLIKQYTKADCQIAYYTLDEKLSSIKMHKSTLQNAELILIPVAYQTHAHLAFIKKEKDGHLAIGILDGGNSEFTNRYLLSVIKPIANKIRRPFKKISVSHYAIPPQSTKYDCVPACAYYAKVLCSQISIETFSNISESVDYTPFRLEIAESLIDFSLTTDRHSNLLVE